MDRYPFIPYRTVRYEEPEMRRRADAFYTQVDSRRSVREFSSDPVPRELIEQAIRSASTAPSGAHRQPWRFVVIGDPAIKKKIRTAAEAEEKKSYEERMPDEWLEALEPFGTTWQKPFLEIVPWIVVVFEELFGYDEEGTSVRTTMCARAQGWPVACSSPPCTTWGSRP